VPATAMSVTLNVTVVDPAADGRITVYSCDPTVPIANSVVFSAHQNVANRIVVQPGSFGAVCISNNVATHLVADLTGYTVAGGRDTAVTPARIADTVMRAPAGTITRVHVAGRSGVPVGAWVATLAVSALSPSASGYLTVFPCNISRPLASNVNFTTAPIAGTVTTRLDDNGDACVANSSPVRVVVDVIGHTA